MSDSLTGILRRLNALEEAYEQTRTKDTPFTNITARVYNTGNQSINNNTTTALTFDSERWDTDGLHSTSSNTSRLTCTRAGKHLIIGQVGWSNSSTAGMREIALRLNGATYLALADNVPNVSFGHNMEVITIYDLVVGDYVELMVYQNSGGALNVAASASYANEFLMHRLP